MTEKAPLTQGFESQLLFDEEALGQSLRELAVDVMPGESTEFLSRWFHSPHNADLFVWQDAQKRIIKYQICLHGEIAEWNPFDGTRTGAIVETEHGDVIENSSESQECSEIIHYDESALSEVITRAVGVLRHVPELNFEQRSLLINLLQSSPRYHKRARERAMQTWASQVPCISTHTRPRFWRRLRNWVLGT